MSDNEYTDIDVGGTTLRMSRAALENMAEAGKFLNQHLSALGALCWSYANLDSAINHLYEPLLDCSEAQVACLMVENISTRCEQLKRLLYLEAELDADFRQWVVDLLVRCSQELAGQRNRFVHDQWGFVWNAQEHKISRVNKRPKIGKPRSREAARLIVREETETAEADITRLMGQVETVSEALFVARHTLATWRQTGSLPPLEPQWLPASKPKALGHQSTWSPEERAVPPPPYRYEFD
jgi:hypothetical protein